MYNYPLHDESENNLDEKLKEEDNSQDASQDSQDQSEKADVGDEDNEKEEKRDDNDKEKGDDDDDNDKEKVDDEDNEKEDKRDDEVGKPEFETAPNISMDEPQEDHSEVIIYSIWHIFFQARSYPLFPTFECTPWVAESAVQNNATTDLYGMCFEIQAEEIASHIVRLCKNLCQMLLHHSS